MVATALALGACRSAPAGGGHRILGEYDVHGVYGAGEGGSPRPGQACAASTVGYQDIHPGTPVVFRDGAGTVLARVALGAGAIRMTAGFRDDCVYRFSATVPDAPAYQIEVGSRGSVAFSRQELAKAGWRAQLTIGNYTLGT